MARTSEGPFALTPVPRQVQALFRPDVAYLPPRAIALVVQLKDPLLRARVGASCRAHWVMTLARVEAALRLLVADQAALDLPLLQRVCRIARGHVQEVRRQA